ncbi:MAG: aldo/keto reductase [Lachnospiraceae bacterium]|nr:aldo/keto reductase [Lachnospiraceae bacterium]
MCFEKDLKKLGFGFMRLPKNENGIDMEETKAMVDSFMEAGFTYFDTAWLYPGSEEALGEALVKRYPRESYLLATKLSAWAGCKDREEAIAQFDISLERTGAGYFDYYLLHNIGEGRTHYYEDFDIWSFVRELKESGRIRHYGFSFHSTPEELDAVLTAHPDAEFVQIQFNYADLDNPAVQCRRVYEVARAHGKPIIVMEPVKGGQLATPPESVARILREAEPDSSLASWALRFAASQPGVAVVLSGMSTVSQVEDNISFMKDFRPLTDDQMAVIEDARAELAKIPLIPCTTCNYCAKVCPMEIGISGTFTAMNMVTLYNNLRFAKGQERWLVGGHGRRSANECIKCRACVEACPQHISIPEELEKAVELFGLRSRS